jgi:phosphate transport system substrate-binding protein
MRSTRQMITMALVCAAVLSGRSAGGQSLVNGAGATFPTPLYTRWFNTYARIDQSVRFNYQSIGSGAGIAQIISRQVDFVPATLR